MNDITANPATTTALTSANVMVNWAVMLRLMRRMDSEVLDGLCHLYRDPPAQRYVRRIPQFGGILWPTS